MGDGDPEERPGGGGAHDGGDRGSKAMSSAHDRPHVEGYDGPGDLSVRTA
jgi:hypothetical protein